MISYSFNNSLNQTPCGLGCDGLLALDGMPPPDKLTEDTGPEAKSAWQCELELLSSLPKNLGASIKQKARELWSSPRAITEEFLEGAAIVGLISLSRGSGVPQLAALASKAPLVLGALDIGRRVGQPIFDVYSHPEHLTSAKYQLADSVAEVAITYPILIAGGATFARGLSSRPYFEPLGKPPSFNPARSNEIFGSSNGAPSGIKAKQASDPPGIQDAKNEVHTGHDTSSSGEKGDDVLRAALQSVKEFSRDVRRRVVYAEASHEVVTLAGDRVLALSGSHVTAKEGSIVRATSGSQVTAEAGALVWAASGSNVIARPKSFVVLNSGAAAVVHKDARAWAYPGSFVTNLGGTVSALEQST